ncbi:hypothetical protein [Methylobacterium sp. 17Sr1-1]|uniref:hypothetical protein n=1 Tax=Methylobacterium sp. 17Sr1-1 TaxID=2202826 RepID=UPI0013A55D63|nr:hypothetical protein [Methylobacterium sp. 17Sr1-1]
MDTKTVNVMIWQCWISQASAGSARMSKSFGEFYRAFGFVEYPFSVFTSENEQTHGKDLFVDFSMYSPIIEGFNNGRTMIIAGDRGTGKTAILYDFSRRASNDSLLVSISDYSDLSLSFNSANFYKFAISNLAERLFAQMADDRKSGSSLSKQDKVLLSYFLAHFVRQASKNELHRKVAALQMGWGLGYRTSFIRLRVYRSTLVQMQLCPFFLT